VELDATDLHILQVLLEDGRISVARLAEQVNVSRANAYARVTRLRERGVITGFTVALDSERLGLELSAVVLISLDNRQGIAAVADRVAAMPEVEFAAFLTGQYDAMLLVRFPDVAALRRFTIERLQALPGLRSTVTSLILSEIRSQVPPLGAMLDGAPEDDPTR
jgi:DNA-binding Lrp family transcriptional regulator